MAEQTPPISPATSTEPTQQIRSDVRRFLFLIAFFLVLIVVAAFGLVAEF